MCFAPGDLVSSVSTVKFDLQDDLDELQARIFLDTRKKLSKKEVLELVFRLGAQNYEKILETLLSSEEYLLNDEIINQVLSLAEDLGPGTEELSSQVDEIVYGARKDKKDGNIH